MKIERLAIISSLDLPIHHTSLHALDTQNNARLADTRHTEKVQCFRPTLYYTTPPNAQCPNTWHSLWKSPNPIKRPFGHCRNASTDSNPLVVGATLNKQDARLQRLTRLLDRTATCAAEPSRSTIYSSCTTNPSLQLPATTVEGVE
jgi:hypothetical protein